MQPVQLCCTRASVCVGLIAERRFNDPNNHVRESCVHVYHAHLLCGRTVEAFGFPAG